MTINNLKAFVAALWDWGFLDTCFPGLIRASDIDGFVEHNGHTIFLEGKPEGKPIPKGQKIAFQSWASQGNHTLVIWGPKPNIPTKALLIGPKSEKLPKGEKLYDPINLEGIKKIAKAWYEWAHRNGK